MRQFIITALILSTCLSIQTHRQLFVNKAACNHKDQSTAFFPMGINFSTSMKNLNSLQVSTSAMIPCFRSETMEVEFIFNERGTVTTMNQVENVVEPSLSRTAPMKLAELNAWWKEFAGTFKGIVVGADISSTSDLISIELFFVNSEVIATLEALGKNFVENKYNYNFDEMRPVQTQTVIKTQAMTPEMMDIFKKQLMTQDNMAQLLDNVQGHNQAMIESQEIDGNKVQVVVKRQLVQMVNNNHSNFLV